MKKILLLASVTLLSSQIALGGLAGSPYVKLGGGLSKEEDLKIGNIKTKSKPYGFAEVGIGYNATENARFDVTFSHYFLPTKNFAKQDDLGNSSIKYSSTKLGQNFDTLLLNGYVDLFDAGMAKFFVGGGVGLAMTKFKTTKTYKIEQKPTTVSTNSFTTNNGITTTQSSTNYSASQSEERKSISKTAINSAYSLAAGVSAELSEKVSLELAYNLRGIILSKEAKKIVDKSTINSHNVVLGVRFSL